MLLICQDTHKQGPPLFLLKYCPALERGFKLDFQVFKVGKKYSCKC